MMVIKAENGDATSSDGTPRPPFPAVAKMETTKDRLARVAQMLSLSPAATSCESQDKRLDMDEIRWLTFKGLEETTEADSSSSAEVRRTRAMVWRLLLGVLDDEPSTWTAQLMVKRAQYHIWKREFLSVGRQGVSAREADATQPRQQQQDETDAKDREDRDAALMKEISKDVSRTRSELSFFSIGSMAQQWMLRILFVHAKLHPELGYIQGMNEILAPILYAYGTDPDDNWVVETEADAFFSFSTIMAATKLLYLTSPSDPTKSGVDMQMTRLAMLLRQHDALLWQHLVRYHALHRYILALSLTLRVSVELHRALARLLQLPLVHDVAGARLRHEQHAAALGRTAERRQAVQLPALRQLRTRPVPAPAAAAPGLRGRAQAAANAADGHGPEAHSESGRNDAGQGPESGSESEEILSRRIMMNLHIAMVALHWALGVLSTRPWSRRNRMCCCISM